MAKTMNRRSGVPVGAVLLACLIGADAAEAAQINTFLIPEHDEGCARFMGLKFIQIKYPQGSSVANVFNGVNEKLDLILPLSEPQLEQVNRVLFESNRPMQLARANVTYSGIIRGSHDTLTLAYKTEINAFASEYVLSQPSNDTAETILVYSNWRGFVMKGPLMVDSGSGEVNVNEPIGLQQAKFPEFAQQLLYANAETRSIVTQPILDFDDIGKMPLERWHVLFDPTWSQASVKGILDTDIGREKCSQSTRLASAE